VPSFLRIQTRQGGDFRTRGVKAPGSGTILHRQKYPIAFSFDRPAEDKHDRFVAFEPIADSPHHDRIRLRRIFRRLAASGDQSVRRHTRDCLFVANLPCISPPLRRAPRQRDYYDQPENGCDDNQPKPTGPNQDL